jgi:hypothetical protein
VVIGLAIAWFTRSDPVFSQRCTASVNGVDYTLDPDQARNAALIAVIGAQRGLPARASSIAIATAIQESKLRNIDYGDRDSLGLFQQRPSQGWGTPEQIMDPVYATNAFYDVLVKIEGFESLPITDAAQKVQRSGFPQAYADNEPEARAYASALTVTGRGGRRDHRGRTGRHRGRVLPVHHRRLGEQPAAGMVAGAVGGGRRRRPRHRGSACCRPRLAAR